MSKQIPIQNTGFANVAPGMSPDALRILGAEANESQKLDYIINILINRGVKIHKNFLQNFVSFLEIPYDIISFLLKIGVVIAICFLVYWGYEAYTVINPIVKSIESAINTVICGLDKIPGVNIKPIPPATCS